MTQIAAATGNIETMKSSYRKYTAALWSEDFEENRYESMMKYYNEHVKSAKVTAHRREDGAIEVRGLR